MSAKISKCGKYRYNLWRSILDDNGYPISEKTMVFVMLNPSTADAELDDPTIRRCKDFAKRHNCGHLHVVNLFAYRATSPKELKLCDNPEGDENLEAVKRAVEDCFYPITDRGIVVCAWGNHGTYMQQDETVLGWITEYGITPHCLGVTKAGNPKHPLYLKADSRLMLFEKGYNSLMRKTQ
jgi:hypothetical protein